MDNVVGGPEGARRPGAAAAGTGSDHGAPGVVGAAIMVGTAALFILGLQPILLGGLNEAGRLSAAGLGVAAMIEVLALAIGAAIGPPLMNSGAMRVRTAMACLLLAAVNLGLHWASTPALIYLDRALAGVLEGGVLAAALVVLTHTRQPDRVSGLFLAIQTIPQAIAAYLLPVWLIPRWGVEAGFVLLALFALAAALGALALVDRVRVHADQVRPPLQWSPAVAAFLLAVLAQNAGIGAAWNYIERLASQHGYAPAIVGLAVSGSLVFQVGGAFFVAGVGWRLPHRVVLVAGAFAQAAIVLLMAKAAAPGVYVLAGCAFGMFWLALQPFQVRQAIALEPSRRIALLVTPLALIGLSIGPLLVSALVRPGDVSGAFDGAAGFLGMSGLAFGGAWALERLARRAA